MTTVETPRLSSVRNAARVLKAFSARKRSFGVTELARTLDLSTSTAHRLLTSLAEEGLIEQDAESGRYQLGMAVYDLFAAMSEYDLTEAVLPPMTVLRHRTGETVQVGVLDGREVVYVERLQSPRTLRMFIDVGRRNTTHATATGKVLLANLPPDRLDMLLDGQDLDALTEHTITDHERLRAELRRIRDAGFGVNSEEAEIGAVSVGAPIRDGSGEVVAALSVAGPTARMLPQIDDVSRMVREAATAASRRLGLAGTGGRS